MCDMIVGFSIFEDKVTTTVTICDKKSSKINLEFTPVVLELIVIFIMNYDIYIYMCVCVYVCVLGMYSHVLSIKFLFMLYALPTTLTALTVRCETSVLDMTGMLWTGVLDVIIVSLMTGWDD